MVWVNWCNVWCFTTYKVIPKGRQGGGETNGQSDVQTIRIWTEALMAASLSPAQSQKWKLVRSCGAHYLLPPRPVAFTLSAPCCSMHNWIGSGICTVILIYCSVAYRFIIIFFTTIFRSVKKKFRIFLASRFCNYCCMGMFR
jgi:hypothetical protein